MRTVARVSGDCSCTRRLSVFTEGRYRKTQPITTGRETWESALQTWAKYTKDSVKENVLGQFMRSFGSKGESREERPWQDRLAERTGSEPDNVGRIFESQGVDKVALEYWYAVAETSGRAWLRKSPGEQTGRETWV